MTGDWRLATKWVADLRSGNRRNASRPGRRSTVLQPVVRILVAGEENLFLALEVVIEVALVHLQRRGDPLDRRAVVAHSAERDRGALENLDARRRADLAAAAFFQTPA